MMRDFVFTVALLMLASFIVFGCTEEWDDEYFPTEESAPFTFIDSIPKDGDVQVPRKSDLVIHFNRVIDASTLSGTVKVRRLFEDGHTSDVPSHVSAIGTNLYIQPLHPLPSGCDFSIEVYPTFQSEAGELPQIPEEGMVFEFTTAPERAQSVDRPEVIKVEPDPTDSEIFDFSVFRVYFSEPVDESTVLYGKTVKLSIKGTDDLVPAMAFAKGGQIVIDPDGPALDPSFEYELEINKGLMDRNGQSLEAVYSASYTVVDTFPHNPLGLQMCPTLGSQSPCDPVGDQAQLPLSTFTGNPQNTLQIDSTLIGFFSTPFSGTIVAELGNPGLAESYIPFTIRKGQQFFADSFELKMGGEIPSGFQTSNLVVTLLTDGVGRISQSAGKKNPLVNITLDVAINATGANAGMNAMISQPILGVRLSGQAAIGDSGMMEFETSGFAQMEILGEKIPVTISLLLATPQEAMDSTIVADEVPPVLLSLFPGKDNRDRVRLTEDVVATFNEPLDPVSVADNFRVQQKTGAIVPGATKTLGSKIIFTPTNPLEPNTDYQIIFGVGIKDIAGNRLSFGKEITFTTGAKEVSSLDDNPTNPPLLTSINPGDGDQPRFPAHFPIVVCFDQLMDPNSIRLGDTFQVIDLDNANEQVKGTIYQHWNYFVFEPDEPFNSAHVYRVVVSETITSMEGLKLDTDRDRNPGGESHQVEFRADPENEWVMMTLRLDPIADTDGNGYFDNYETATDTNTLWFNTPLVTLFDQPGYVSGRFILWAKGMIYPDSGTPFFAIDVNDGTALNASSIPIVIGSKYDKGLLDPLGRMYFDMTRTGWANISKGRDNANINLSLQTEFNVENNTFNDVLTHSLPISANGRLTFSDEGQLVALMNGSAKIYADLLGLPIPINAQMNLQGVTEAVINP